MADPSYDAIARSMRARSDCSEPFPVPDDGQYPGRLMCAREDIDWLLARGATEIAFGEDGSVRSARFDRLHMGQPAGRQPADVSGPEDQQGPSAQDPGDGAPAHHPDGHPFVPFAAGDVDHEPYWGKCPACGGDVLQVVAVGGNAPAVLTCVVLLDPPRPTADDGEDRAIRGPDGLYVIGRSCQLHAHRCPRWEGPRDWRAVAKPVPTP